MKQVYNGRRFRSKKGNPGLELVSESNDLQQCCESLIETAKRLGSDDNITCVLVRIVTG